MSNKWRDPMWAAYKEIIRRYGSRTGEQVYGLGDQQKRAVQAAIEATEALPNGADRLRLIDLVFWTRTHTLDGAALKLYVSKRTARRWHTEFIREVEKNLWGEKNSRN